MSRNLMSRLQSAEGAPPPEPPRRSGTQPDSRPKRDSRGGGDPDAWIKRSLVALCVAMVLLVGWRVAESLEPASKRMGTEMLVLSTEADGPLTFSVSQGGFLQEVGAVAGLSARGSDYFVARSGTNAVTVYRTKSKQGKTIVYDKGKQALTYKGDPEKYFSPLTGKGLAKDMDDELLVVPSTLTGNMVQING